jgi:hypothetical protein
MFNDVYYQIQITHSYFLFSMASSRNDIPQVILIPRMKATNKSIQEGDDVTEASNGNSTNHVSVASLGSKQTDSTNKSVVAVDSPAQSTGSKSKRQRTQSSFYTPGSSKTGMSAATSTSKTGMSAATSTSPTVATKRNLEAILDDSEDDEDERVTASEQAYIDAKNLLKQDTGSVKLVLEALEAERAFYQPLFTLTKRTGGAVKWKGWTEGYIQLISLSKAGEKYYKTRSKYNTYSYYVVY